MDIRFVGSENGLMTFKTLLQGKANVSSGADAQDALIFEISSVETLYKIPKRSFGVPVFFYLTTPSKHVIVNIKEHRVAGLFIPPLNADTVISKITHSLTLSASVNERDYETLRIKIIAKAENIPALPAVAQDLIKLTSNISQAKIETIISKIKMDQGIASKVLKLVNSPFYGIRNEISSIEKATMLLGFNSVKNIALAISIDQYYKKPFNMYKTTGQAIWQHAYNVACISSEIGKHIQQDKDALYMAGLMHDIGKVVMADFLVKEVSCVQDEIEQLGCDHAEIAAFIMNKWSVVPAIVEAVRTHHKTGNGLYGQIVSIANRIDHDRSNTEEYVYQLSSKYQVQNADILKESILKFLNDGNNEN